MGSKHLGIINYSFFENEDGPVWFAKCRDKDGEPYIIELQDERLDPVMYVLKKDYKYFRDTARSLYMDHLIKRTGSGIETYWKENTVAIYTKNPRDRRKLMKIIRGIPYFNADIPWDTYVAQLLQLKGFIKVDNYSKFSFTNLDDIKTTTDSFQVQQNICYWDIEIDGSRLESLREAWKEPDRYDIISYVAYNPMANIYTYYGWMKGWKREMYTEEHDSNIHLSPKLENNPMLKNYPKKASVIVKKFGYEKDMHLEFIDDFGKGDYDGLLMFNGRGGNIVDKTSGNSRVWRNGFDMPMWYEKCKRLGIKKELYYMSPVPESNTWRKPVRRVQMFKDGHIQKYEIKIDCVPQHDIYFDNTIMKFTKDQENMKNEKLDTYLSNFLGIGKVKHEGMVWELFYKDWKQEKYYNIIDVEGMFALDLYLGFTKQVLGRAMAYCGKVSDVMYTAKLHDHIYLWYASGKYCLDIRNQTRGRWGGFIEKKMGGYNHPIKKGGTIIGYPKKEFGFIVDFSKLYPTCAMSVNADLRTKVEFDRYDNMGKIVVDRFGKRYKIEDLCRSPSGFFRKDIKSQNTEIYQSMIDERNKVDEKKAWHMEQAKAATSDPEYYYHSSEAERLTTVSHSYKGLINGKFGADGMGGDESKNKPRNYDKVIYNTPPSMGQEILKYLLGELLPKYGYIPFFASTDSAMVKAKSNTAWDTWREAEELSKKINDDLGEFIQKKYNPIHNYINIGCEKVFSQCILFNKRMYMLKTVIEDTKKGPIELKIPKTYIRGLEFLKNNSSMVVTKVQYKLLKMFIDMKSMEEIQEYARKIDKEFDDYEWDYIAEISSISRNIDQYKGTFEKAKACGNANLFCDKDYQALARPFLGYFSEVPNYNDGVPKDVLYCNSDGIYPIAFDEGDRKDLEDKKFVLDYNKHKSMLVKKIERFFTLAFGMDYWEFIEEEADACEI